MATKAFYRAKRDHMRPLRNIYQRAVRALESGVPVGRGHPWQLPAEAGDTRRRLPNWKQHDWTMNVVSALKECPPAGWGSVRQSIHEIKEFEIPFEKLLKKFLKRHPEVVWRIPYNNFADTLWAPTLFAKRQAELIKTKGISEEAAYQEVVKEGGGGGDWNGIWESLEHDRVRSVLKKEAQHIQDEAQRRKNGVSLLKAYNEAQHADIKYGITKSTWGIELGGKHRSKKAEKLLETRATAASKQEFMNDILDLGVLFKVRAIQEKREEQARREQNDSNSHSNPPPARSES